MPRVVLDKKVTEYTTAMYNCVDWLDGLGFKFSQDVWEWEMEKLRDEYTKNNLATPKPPPGFENCFDPLKD